MCIPRHFFFKRGVEEKKIAKREREREREKGGKWFGEFKK